MHVYSDPASERHVPGARGVPGEVSGRRGRGGKAERRSCKPAEDDTLVRVHVPAYLDSLRELCAAGQGYLNLDTALNRSSWEAASLASGAARNVPASHWESLR